MVVALPWHVALSLVLLLAAWPGSLKAGSLRKVWELDLKKIVHEKGARHASDLKVRKLKFSPDGRQIAAGVFGPRTIVVQAGTPESSPKEFPLIPFWNDFDWSPDGNLLLIERSIVHVHLENGQTCKLPDTLFSPRFISNDRIIGSFTELSEISDIVHKKASHLRLYDADCRETEKWEVPEKWDVRDVSIERGLLSVGRSIMGPQGPTLLESLIVNPFARKVLHRWSGADDPGGFFADSGGAICTGNKCWDYDTGKKISDAPPGIQRGRAKVAIHASRIEVDNFGRGLGMDMPFFSVFPEAFARRVVWDFRTGKEVVSWHAKFITYSRNLLDFTEDREAYPCAISPDGEYIAEGGEGKIWLYKIEP